MIGTKVLKNRFTYHPPNEEQTSQYQQLRAMGHRLALRIDRLAPDGYEKENAVKAIEEAVMWANAAIARGSEPAP